MATRAFAVVNPAAGGGAAARAWPRLADRLVRGRVDVTSAVTAASGDATRLACRAAGDGHDLVIAVGGDGTVNEVVNGLLVSGASRVTLGVLPAGRGRDVCRNLGIPRDLDRAVDRVVHGSDVAVDVGVVDFGDRIRFFLGATGAGFDADVARRTQRHRGPATLAYIAGVIEAVASLRPALVTVTGAFEWTGRATAVVVANGAFVGGGMKIAPGADPADGALDVVVLGDVGRLELLRWLPSVYRGDHVRHPRVVTARATEVRISAPTPLPVHVDGEPAGSTPIVVSVRPGALTVRR
ncbi:MAG: diacylglycerol kinase family lipid kinase [Candidatus Rokubacteria bacterium]|nr:diacylglycerol kinase family lipid kinase [Candidatus Rokubacteria bacterium]